MCFVAFQDMNRVVVKPNTDTVEQNNRPDQVIGLSSKSAFI